MTKVSNFKNWNTYERLRTVQIRDIMAGASSYLLENMCAYAIQDPTEPINIIFTSDGGSVMEAIAATSAIGIARDLLDPSVPIIGTVHGNASSSGSLLLQCCDIRRCMSDSFIMVHGISRSFFGGDDRTIDADSRNVEKLRNRFIDLYGARSAEPRSYWEELMRDNHPNYYTAEEAKEKGLIDEIIPSLIINHDNARSYLERYKVGNSD